MTFEVATWILFPLTFDLQLPPSNMRCMPGPYKLDARGSLHAGGHGSPPLRLKRGAGRDYPLPGVIKKSPFVKGGFRGI